MVKRDKNFILYFIKTKKYLLISFVIANQKKFSNVQLNDCDMTEEGERERGREGERVIMT